VVDVVDVDGRLMMAMSFDEGVDLVSTHEDQASHFSADELSAPDEFEVPATPERAVVLRVEGRLEALVGSTELLP
jgi:hypothetical protein